MKRRTSKRRVNPPKEAVEYACDEVKKRLEYEELNKYDDVIIWMKRNKKGCRDLAGYSQCNNGKWYSLPLVDMFSSREEYRRMAKVSGNVSVFAQYGWMMFVRFCDSIGIHDFYELRYDTVSRFAEWFYPKYEYLAKNGISEIFMEGIEFTIAQAIRNSGAVMFSDAKLKEYSDRRIKELNDKIKELNDKIKELS